MRYMIYYKNREGALVLRYSDDDGKHIREAYIGYTLKEAIQRFRDKHGLKGKRIDIASLDGIGEKK